MTKSKVKYIRRKPQVPVRKWGCKGRPIKHGGYSLAIRDQVLKENPRATRYLVDTRTGLVRDVAGSEDALSEQQRVMIDRIISKLAICRLIELYVEKYGAFPQIKDGRKTIVKMELHACLGVNYLAFSNAIDRALVALGLSKKQLEAAPTIAEIIREHDEAAAKAKEGQGNGNGKGEDQVAGAEDGPGVAPGGQTQAGEGQGQGDGDD